jgi:hypothetical protein
MGVPRCTGTSVCLIRLRQRYSARRIILRSWSSTPLEFQLMAGRVSADSRIHAPRNDAINSSSSRESPRRNRRTGDFTGFSARATRAVTKALRTADLLSVRKHTDLWILPYYAENEIAVQGGVCQRERGICWRRIASGDHIPGHCPAPAESGQMRSHGPSDPSRQQKDQHDQNHQP